MMVPAIVAIGASFSKHEKTLLQNRSDVMTSQRIRPEDPKRVDGRLTCQFFAATNQVCQLFPSNKPP